MSPRSCVASFGVARERRDFSVAPFASQTEYFGDAKQMWMVNFARLHDLERNPIELWESPQLTTA